MCGQNLSEKEYEDAMALSITQTAVQRAAAIMLTLDSFM
tara:strand:- start:1433 stop:1549 length:117 start_codon:yes stop_codon:yes gene_type:complete